MEFMCAKKKILVVYCVTLEVVEEKYQYSNVEAL